ncbi:hypothetical protein AB4Z52_34780 [Rhizobium sp. 2YAF20]|uniref:DUF7674 family protein n=1 Tax=Rhizobium sp. 2YAF20 TaxID=3233027 RepID=UPI003F98D082
MEAADFINQLKLLLPEVLQIEERLNREFFPSQIGINSLCADVGWHIADSFQSVQNPQAVFDVIESGMLAADNNLKDAIATGLIEALISRTDSSPASWKTIFPYLGPLSAAYAEAWIKFTDTGNI